MLAALEVEAVSLRDEYPESVPDDVFLELLRQNHDVYVTYDHRQRTREAEARAIREAKVTAIWFGPFWGKKDFWQQAKWLVNRWEQIDAFTRNVVPGTCAEIREGGKAMLFKL